MTQTDATGGIGTVFPAVARVVPAGMKRRSLARLLDLLIGLAAVGALVIVALLGPDTSDARSVTAFSLAVQVCSVALVVGVLAVFAVTGMLPGGAIAGVRQVRVSTGGPPGPAGVVKYLVLGAISVLTVGLGYLATILTIARDPWHRSWVDRWLGLLVIDIRVGGDPRHEALGGPLQSAALPLENYDPAPRPRVPAAPAPAAQTAGDELTTRLNPRVAAQVKPVQVRLPDRSTVLVEGPTAFGRNPVNPPGRAMTRLVSLDDPGRSVSKTHAILTPQPGGVLVEDLHSTNGTSILTGGGQVVVPPGVRLAARTGWRVALADFVLVVEDA